MLNWPTKRRKEYVMAWRKSFWWMVGPSIVLIGSAGLCIAYTRLDTGDFAQALTTLAAGLMAGLAAIGASQLTGSQIQRIEEKKHNRLVNALKIGLVEELLWAISEIENRLVCHVGSQSEVFAYADLGANQERLETTVFGRSADQIAAAGGTFAIAIIRANAILRYPKMAHEPSRYTGPQIARLAEYCWKAAIELPTNCDTRHRTCVIVKEITHQLYFVLNSTADIQLRYIQRRWIDEFIEFAKETWSDEEFNEPSARMLERQNDEILWNAPRGN